MLCWQPSVAFFDRMSVSSCRGVASSIFKPFAVFCRLLSLHLARNHIVPHVSEVCQLWSWFVLVGANHVLEKQTFSIIGVRQWSHPSHKYDMWVMWQMIQVSSSKHTDGFLSTLWGQQVRRMNQNDAMPYLCFYSDGFLVSSLSCSRYRLYWFSVKDQAKLCSYPFRS